MLKTKKEANQRVKRRKTGKKRKIERNEPDILILPNANY